MRKNRLMSPGPTPVPERVLLRTAENIIHHRTPQFRSVLKDVNEKLKKLLATENPVLILASSGTGAMEASVVNLLSGGDKALCISGGKFGERFGEICRAYGGDPVDYDVTWGEAADPAVIEKMLTDDPGIKAVYATLCETSTGVLNDIKAIGKVVSATDAVLVVDAISGLSADELKADEWGIDVVVCGSQKGLMLPPGLGLLSVSDKARKLIDASDMPKYYFSLADALKSYEKNDTPWTPAISLIKGLNEALDIMLEEGLDVVLERHALLADATRQAMKALGLELFTEKPSNALTAVKVPEGIDGVELVGNLRDKEGITVAGGQAQLKGKIFRLGHLGHMDIYDTISAIAAIEITLRELGADIKLGTGVAKAQEVVCARENGTL